jgi:hypothetical protein
MSLTHAYCTVAELADELEMNATETSNKTAKLERAISAASRMIDKHTGWVAHGFWQDPSVVARVYEPDEADELCIPEGISTLTGLIVKVDYTGTGTYGTTLTINTDFTVCPANALSDYPARPITELEIMWSSSNYFPTEMENTVQVTAKFGWPAVPDDVNKATLIQAAQMFKAPDAVFGGVPIGLDGGFMRVRSALNPMAEGLLEGYCKPRVA